MRRSLQALAVLAVLFTASVVFAADTYTVDPNHTTFGFAAQHMMISNVSGEFDKFSGQIMYSPTDLANSKANITIDAASINTRIEKRDAHLKSPDFFDVAKYPTITFVSTKFTPTAITGNLTMKGITQEVTIPVTVSGPVKGMMGGQVIGITGSVIINRQNWGISWNKNLDEGGVVVSDNVTVNISIEADAK